MSSVASRLVQAGGDELGEVEALLGEASQEGLILRGVDLGSAGEHPEELALGLTDGSEAVVLVEIDDPVVTPDERKEVGPLGSEADLKLGGSGGANLTSDALSDGHLASFGEALVDDGDLAILSQRVISLGAGNALVLEGVLIAGDLEPAAHVAGDIERFDGLNGLNLSKDNSNAQKDEEKNVTQHGRGLKDFEGKIRKNRSDEATRRVIHSTHDVFDGRILI